MAIRTYSPEEKDSLVSEFNLSGKNLFTFYNEKKKARDMPSFQDLRRWIDDSKPTTTTTTKLYQEFTQILLPQDSDKKYIAFLEKKVTSLQARIAELEGKD